MEQLLTAIRDACPRAIWSRGVELARRDVVTGESETAEEIVLRVTAAPHAPANEVVLYPSDEEWECDCNARTAVCAHVVAAALAVGKLREAGGDLPALAASGGLVRYRLIADSGGLALERFVLRGEVEEPLPGTLQSLVGRGETSVAANQTDLRVDRLLGTKVRGRLADDRLAHLFSLLGGSDQVYLGDRNVRLSTDEIQPLAYLENSGDGVRLRIERDPAIDEVVASRVVRIGDRLHLIGETELSGRRLEKLPFAQQFAPSAFGELITRLLPELRLRTALTIATDRLPGVDTETPPRIALELDERDGHLSVMATLVYGDPPQARIDDGRLVHLGGPVPVRDTAAEQRLLRDLRDRLDLLPGHRRTVSGQEAAELAGKLRAFRGQVRGGELLDAPELAVELATDGDRFGISFAAGGVRADTRQVLAAWRHDLDLVPLSGGGFARLPADWLDRHGARVTALLAARDSTGALPAHAAPELARLCDELDRPRPPFADRIAPLVDDFTGLPAAELPDDLTATLRPYQRAGVDWLSFLAVAGLGGILADDMGLGKTVQTLAALPGRTLVVCPRSVVHNWADEIAAFRPALSVATYHGAGRALDPDADVTLTTYGTLRQDADALAAAPWDAIVLDEAQAIKNPESQTAAAARALPGRFRLALTGTPIENRLDELWSLLDFCNPGLLGGRADFKRELAEPAAGGDQAALDRLRERIRPFVLRRLKRDVLPELPPRTDSVLHVELDDTERAVYDAVRAATRDDLVKILAGGGSVLAALEALLRLRQAACHPALLPGQQAERSSKLDRLVAVVSEAAADGHKSLVFSQWTGALDLIGPAFTEAGIDFVRLDGSTRDRRAVVEAFQSPDGPPAMLISLKAGGTGLNLTAADHVFLFDPWWNPATEDQAADRAHRIGQDRPVNVYRLVADDTVEERILALQQRKRALADAALDGGAAAAGLTRDDLLALLA